MLDAKIIQKLIENDATSDKKKFAKVGQSYYDGDHDIKDYKLYYYNSDGKVVEDRARSNIKLEHPFFTELVDQCVQYLLSGKSSIVRADDQNLQKELDSYFNDTFKAELEKVLTDTCVNGFGYMYCYKNAEDRLAFERAAAMGVVEVRVNETSVKADCILYWYIDGIANNNQQIKRIQVWDREQTYYYVQIGNGAIELDTSMPFNPRPHVVYQKGGQYYQESLGFIPFFKLAANEKQFSHLKPIKSLIDDYDITDSGWANNLQDMSEAVFVVKGYEGDNIEELITNIKTKKAIGVDETGDIDIKTFAIPVEARRERLLQLKQDIYRFDMGFDATQLGDGNITNVVIKSRYALLDLKCNKLESRLRAFLQPIVEIVIDEINMRLRANYKATDAYLVFDREILTNASDNAVIDLTKAQTEQTRITTLLNMGQILGDEQILQSVCEILELDIEKVKELRGESIASSVNLLGEEDDDETNA